MTNFHFLFIYYFIVILLYTLFTDSASTANDENNNSKIAFLFITKGALPLSALWVDFFKHVSNETYKIYVHAPLEISKSYQFPFKGTAVKNPILVQWGTWSLAQAEIILFREALLDPLNCWFILLSESCAPLRDFYFTQNYLKLSNFSFLDSVGSKKRRLPIKSIKHIWKTGSQWAVLRRQDVVVLVNDSLLLDFDNFFAQAGKNISIGRSNRNNFLNYASYCCIDEHYKQIILDGKHKILLERRSLTGSLWPSEQYQDSDSRKGHPITYHISKTDKGAFSYFKNITCADLNQTRVLATSARKCVLLFARKFIV